MFHNVHIRVIINTWLPICLGYTVVMRHFTYMSNRRMCASIRSTELVRELLIPANTFETFHECIHSDNL